MSEALAVPGSPDAAQARGGALLALLFPVIIVAFYWETAWSMVSIWQRSETYTHGFLIVPIVAWLIWNKRELLSDQRLSPVLWLQLLLIPGGFVWLLAYLADVLVVQQLALVGILIVGIWSIVGHQIARIIAFPLGFLFLGVPMGEDLVPPMMEMTATSTVWLIKLTGIPVYREGLYFTLPTGYWSVVEACSGVRYLIASFTLGLLYAHLTYRSVAKQLLFVVVSILVPIAANTARAYMIVMLGHLSGMTIATGIDHLIYGWVFFGLVMLLLFWIGSFWREDNGPEIDPREAATTAPHSITATNGVLALTMALVIAGFWPLFALATRAPQMGETGVILQTPQSADSWLPAGTAPWDWQPVDSGADALLTAFYQQENKSVALYLQLYLQQKQGAELVSGKSGQFVDQEQSWRIAERDSVAVVLGGEQLFVDQLHLSDGDRQLLLWNWYRIGEHYTANPYIAKWYEALAAISFARRDSARVIIATPLDSEAQNQALLQSFIDAQLPAVESSLDNAVHEGGF